MIASLHHGGTEMQTLHTARALSEMGYGVGLLCLFTWDQTVRRLFESAGVEVECLELSRRRNCFGLLWRVAQRIRAARPDCAHVQYIAPGLLAVAAARAAGVRVLITIHQTGTAYGWREHFLFRTATRLAETTICVSRAVAQSWFEEERRGLPRAGKHAVVRNCAGPVTILPRGGKPERPWTIGYAGRVRQEKGVDLLVRAAALLARSRPGFRVVIAGDGPQRAECEALARELGVSARIEWLGLAPPERLPELYASFDVLVAPSRSEGFGLAAAEAMAHGVPVVAARVGGLPEIVQDGCNGLLFTAGDYNELASRLEALMDDPPLTRRLGRAARRTVSARFSPAAYRDQLAEVYERL